MWHSQVLPGYLAAQLCRRLAMLYKHNTLEPRLIYDINYLSHKVEKSQSSGCGDVNVINVFIQPQFIANVYMPGWKVSRTLIGSYVYMYQSRA